MPMPISYPEGPLPEPLARVAVQRHAGAQVWPWVDDLVAVEAPIALVFNGISHAVMMATPQDLPELALGFALSEGIIDRVADCRNIELAVLDADCDEAGRGSGVAAVEVRLEISARAFMRLKERRRSLTGRTGCGVCGVDSVQALNIHPEPLAVPPWVTQIGPEAIFNALAAMSEAQALNQASGAVHAAAYANLQGELLATYEDVGRHNALDKLLGARAWAQAHPDAKRRAWSSQGFVVMSSRASYELVHKCARLGVPLLATVSAPTSLAIDVAKAAGLQLWGLARAPRVLRYTR